jgi:hypothetical protein
VNRSIAANHALGCGPLQRRFQGPILLPAQSADDQARRVWNTMVDQRPAVTVRAPAQPMAAPKDRHDPRTPSTATTTSAPPTMTRLDQ